MRRRISAGRVCGMPGDGEAARAGREDRRQHADRGRLAGAVRPEQAEHLAAPATKLSSCSATRVR